MSPDVMQPVAIECHDAPQHRSDDDCHFEPHHTELSPEEMVAGIVKQVCTVGASLDVVMIIVSDCALLATSGTHLT